ncbi:TetR/AcrR family transcriptional regulator [Brevibacterium spongiae]|uniref:TetR/AcrR family transcriptional regulator n=1 Tax=Brevibacterium spongiae TaxID=2909672 RepID=A0ABY5SS53_9MICO|nr:TetR/AcrR family transcriptional regulator [Brevibacterium spongiae]UVI37393.1 TetR/AcrR family transcriptional regulator [Brevibacterium spongiae]
MRSNVENESAAPGEGLRERKKRERRQALRRAAIELALEKGYHHVTVEDICERCGVSRRTFFNYYSSKEEALLGRADTVFDEEDQPAIEEFEAGGPHGDLVDDLEYLLAFIVTTRMSRHEEMHQHHLMLKQDPSLLQLQMARMGNNERRFRQIVQRRLDGRAGPASAAESHRFGTDVTSVNDATPVAEDEEAVSLRAEAVAAMAMMALNLAFTRLRRFGGEPEPVMKELFDELRVIFDESSA